MRVVCSMTRDREAPAAPELPPSGSTNIRQAAAICTAKDLWKKFKVPWYLAKFINEQNDSNVIENYGPYVM